MPRPSKNLGEARLSEEPAPCIYCGIESTLDICCSISFRHHVFEGWVPICACCAHDCLGVEFLSEQEAEAVVASVERFNQAYYTATHSGQASSLPTTPG